MDLMLKCIYGIVHPDDHHELKIMIENDLTSASLFQVVFFECSDFFQEKEHLAFGILLLQIHFYSKLQNANLLVRVI